jgi:hypothetical protein
VECGWRSPKEWKSWSARNGAFRNHLEPSLGETKPPPVSYVTIQNHFKDGKDVRQAKSAQALAGQRQLQHRLEEIVKQGSAALEEFHVGVPIKRAEATIDVAVDRAKDGVETRLEDELSGRDLCCHDGSVRDDVVDLGIEGDGNDL